MNEENVVESNHPVLQPLKDKIAQLETQLASTRADADSMRMRWQGAMSAKNQFEDKVKEALLSALSDNQDEDTVRYIADELGIDLTISKKYEINVTFEIDVEIPFGESFDPEWELDFTVSGSDYMIDSDSNVIYSKEIS